MNIEEAKDAVKCSAQSKVAKSCRRFFFTHCHESPEESDHYYIDIMYGAGTGILLKIKDKFFLLTANHVIKANIPGKYQNESPFIISFNTKLPEKPELTDYFYPKIMWNIGELIKPNSNLIVDDADICLIELFYSGRQKPDNYIDLNENDDFLSKEHTYIGQLLITNGYPLEKNYFKHLDEDDEYGEHYSKSIKKITHYTPHNRHSVLGFLDYEKNNAYISFEYTEGQQNHASLVGMSGGIVCNVQAESNQVKWVGMSVMGGGVLRFIFASDIVNAILNYDLSTYHIIDPAAEI